MWLALLTLAGAEPLVGVSLRPLDRADIVQVDANQTSGVLVGEFDGVVRPNLGLFFGAWTPGRLGVVGSLGVASLHTASYVGDVVQRQAWMVVRPQVDVRVRLRPRDADGPALWSVVGLYGDIPAASDRSNAYSAEEQEAADQASREARARLGGIGLEGGIGVELEVATWLDLGATATLGVHRGVMRDTTAVSVSTWVTTDVALLATARFPRKDEGASE